jgi:hypothetical protein
VFGLTGLCRNFLAFWQSVDPPAELLERNPELAAFRPDHAAIFHSGFALDCQLKHARYAEGARDNQPGAARREVNDRAWQFVARRTKLDGTDRIQRNAGVPSAILHEPSQTLLDRP